MKVSDAIINEINEIATMFHPDFTGEWDWSQANNKKSIIMDKELTSVQNHILLCMHKYSGED